MLETVYLDIDLMEKMCHPLAVAVFDTSVEPIPPFRPHTEQLLDSSLNLPKQAFGGKDLYPELIDKAAIFYYSLIQNHPFPNGNKRIATASLLLFLFINNHWLEADDAELAGWAITVADSGSKDTTRADLTDKLKAWLKEHVVEL